MKKHSKTLKKSKIFQISNFRYFSTFSNHPQKLNSLYFTFNFVVLTKNGLIYFCRLLINFELKENLKKEKIALRLA